MWVVDTILHRLTRKFTVLEFVGPEAETVDLQLEIAHLVFHHIKIPGSEWLGQSSHLDLLPNVFDLAHERLARSVVKTLDVKRLERLVVSVLKVGVVAIVSLFTTHERKEIDILLLFVVMHHKVEPFLVLFRDLVVLYHVLAGLDVVECKEFPIFVLNLVDVDTFPFVDDVDYFVIFKLYGVVYFGFTLPLSVSKVGQANTVEAEVLQDVPAEELRVLLILCVIKADDGLADLGSELVGVFSLAVQHVELRFHAPVIALLGEPVAWPVFGLSLNVEGTFHEFTICSAVDELCHAQR